MSTSPALATIDDFAERLGRDLTTSEAVRAQAALDDASALVRTAAGKTWLTDDELDDVPAAVVAVCCQMVKRLFDNPTGASSMGLGDATLSYSGIGSVGSLYLTKDERQIVRRAAGAGMSGSVNLEIGTPALGGTYIDVVGQDEPMPFTYEPLRP